MIDQIHDIKNWQYLCWAIMAGSLVIKAYYYLQISNGKRLLEFVMDSFSWASPMMIKNFGVNKTRRKYMEVNNKCMIALWLSLLVALILSFY